MKLDEHSLDSIQHIIDRSNEHVDEWQVPERIGDTALRQAEYDNGAG